jgi:hypothetical protein
MLCLFQCERRHRTAARCPQHAGVGVEEQQSPIVVDLRPTILRVVADDDPSKTPWSRNAPRARLEGNASAPEGPRERIRELTVVDEGCPGVPPIGSLRWTNTT